MDSDSDGWAARVGKKQASTATAQARVRKMIKSGKLKKKCCKSKPRCRRCPVLALKKIKHELAA